MKKNLIVYGLIAAFGLFLTATLINFTEVSAADDIPYFLFTHKAIRTTVLKYYQFPQWNPWQCGGFYFHGNPRATTLSPYLIFTFLFGAVAGINLSIVMSVILSGIFAYLAFRNEKLSENASLVSALAYMSSGYLLNRIYLGHFEYITAYPFLPLVFLGAKKKSAVIAATALTLTILVGSVSYIPYFTMFALFVWILDDIRAKRLKKKEKDYLKISIEKRTILTAGMMLILLFMLSAAKLLPILEMTSETEYTARLADVLFHRYKLSGLAESMAFSEIGTERNAHIGLGVLILAVIGLGLNIKNSKNKALLVFNVLILILITKWIVSDYLILFLRIAPVFSKVFNTARILYRLSIFFVFSAALYAAYALSWFEKRFDRKFMFAIYGIFLLSIVPNAIGFTEYITVKTPVEPVKVYEQFTNVDTNEPEYATIDGNFNKLDCYDVIKTVDGYIKVELSVEEGPIVPEEINYTFTPNKLFFRNAAGGTTLNIEYDPRWKSDDAQIVNVGGRIQVQSINDNFSIKYSSKWTLIGMIISIITLIGIAINYFYDVRITFKYQ